MFKCPECGNTDQLDITVTTWARVVIDNDAEVKTDCDAAHNHDYDWDVDSAIRCCSCGEDGTVGDWDTEGICLKCGDYYDDGGDGSNGLCPSCTAKGEDVPND